MHKNIISDIKSKNYNQIHFLTSYVGLRHFLSNYDNEEVNLFITTNYDLYKFISDYMSHKNVEVWYLKNRSNYTIIFFYLLYSRTLKCIKNVSSQDSKIFFYSNKYSTNVFYLIHKLSNFRQVYYIDADPKIKLEDLYTIKSIIINIYLNFINAIIGLKLKYKKWGTVNVLYWENKYIWRPSALLAWKAISNKFNLLLNIDYDEKTSKKILYLHQDLKSWPDINHELSYDRLIELFLKFQKNGFKIHAKNHPLHEKIDFFEFDYIIDPIIPSELIPDSYDLYITFLSLGIKKFPISKSYLLMSYISYYDSLREKIFVDFKRQNFAPFINLDRRILNNLLYDSH